MSSDSECYSHWQALLHENKHFCSLSAGVAAVSLSINNVWDRAKPSLTLYTSAEGTEDVQPMAARVGNRRLLTSPVQEWIVWGRGGVNSDKYVCVWLERLSFLLHSWISSNAFIKLLFASCAWCRFHTRCLFSGGPEASRSPAVIPLIPSSSSLGQCILLHAWQRLRLWSTWKKSSSEPCDYRLIKSNTSSSSRKRMRFIFIIFHMFYFQPTSKHRIRIYSAMYLCGRASEIILSIYNGIGSQNRLAE